MHTIPPNTSARGSSSDTRARLLDLYNRLYAAFGPQHWWPAETPFEMIVGAILTQSAAWTNVEKAIGNIKRAGALSPAALRAMPHLELAKLVYPSGYFNAKAAKLHAFVRHLEGYGDSLDRLFDKEIGALRWELLEIHGVGEETADSIILYAAQKPSFVIDAYTRRAIDRMGLMASVGPGPANSRGLKYQDYRAFFQDNLPPDERMFNEYHALFVRLGKDVCRKREPLCARCPVAGICSYNGTRHVLKKGQASES